MVDHRRAKRFKIHQMIEISFGKEEFIASEGINLSESGMLCKVNIEIDLNARFFILLEVPTSEGKHEISCEAQMVHGVKIDNQWEIGIAFHDLKHLDRKVLKDYIHDLEIK